jgi:octaprenyl-diphosphate synthase
MQNISEIVSFHQADLNKVNQIILKNSIGKSDLILQIAENLINSGGKRIRPLLLIICSKLCGSKNPDIYLNLAAAVEMIHSATLLHDDVVDNSEIRRGKKTANAIWDNKASILVGDYLFSLSFQLMVKSQNLAVLDLLSTTSSIIADGEVLQLQNSHNLNIAEEKYFEIIFGKTAVLFSACCEVGGLINNLDSTKIIALKNLGKNIGMIFQIIDDILDYSSNQNTLGKEIGNDFFEGKVTLPIIKTYQLANQQERKNIEEIFSKNLVGNDKNFDDFNKILNLIDKYQATEKCQEIAISLANHAKNELKLFEPNIFYHQLKNIIDYSLQRIS